MSYENLEAALQAAGNPVELLRNSQIGPVRVSGRASRVHELAGRAAVLARDVRAVRPVAPHDGPVRRGSRRAQAALRPGRQQLQEFKVNQAKQFVACNHDGYVIGDAILFYLDENRFSLVGRPPAGNWVQYNAARPGSTT